MSAWEIIVFILIVLSIGVAIWLLHRSEKMVKNKWKLTAYRLLEEKNPDPKKVKETIKFLRIYGGRISKDPEFTHLDKLLCDLYLEIHKPDDIDKKTKK
jgi:hypothetical protein